MLTVHVYWSKKNFSKYNIFFILQLQSWPIMTDEGKTDNIGSSLAPPPLPKIVGELISYMLCKVFKMYPFSFKMYQ